MATKKKDFNVSLEDLLEVGSHFGHIARRWNPKMSKFIWDKRDGVHIFDLAKTAKALNEACEFLNEQAAEGKQIVMVGTKRQASEIVKEEAKKIGVAYVAERWLGGTITNWNEVKKRINKLVEMKANRDKGEYKKYTKKEQVLIDREIARLERFFGGLVGLENPPEVLFVVDSQKEKSAVREANSKGIKVVAITDSNADPDLVDYPIPANDDAMRSIKLIVEKVSQAIETGMQKRKKK